MVSRPRVRDNKSLLQQDGGHWPSGRRTGWVWDGQQGACTAHGALEGGQFKVAEGVFRIFVCLKLYALEQNSNSGPKPAARLLCGRRPMAASFMAAGSRLEFATFAPKHLIPKQFLRNKNLLRTCEVYNLLMTIRSAVH
jgi:hypothetical protein